MIPEFPEFKKLELSDKEEIERITEKFLPYSDFNFVSMWSWDIKGEMRISQLNNNLLVRFADYVTGEPFYSFLGNNRINDTAEKLIELSKNEKVQVKLRFIPEEIEKKLSGSNFSATTDKDSYDYIYSVSHLANMNNWTQNSSGKNIRSFIRKCPNYIVEHKPIKEAKKDKYIEMFQKWAENKEIEDYLELNEYKALERIFEIKDSNVNIVSIYVNNLLVGFTIYEILSSNYAISHFAKADTAYHHAISDLLNWEEAKVLNEKDVKYFNWEQDLGILGLRKSKEKYKPSFLLKKFTVGNKKEVNVPSLSSFTNKVLLNIMLLWKKI